MEFRGSMVVFLTLIGLAKVRTTIRLLLTTSFVVYCLHYAYWDLFLFLSGSMLADIHFAMDKETPTACTEDISSPLSSKPQISLWIMRWRKTKPILNAAFWLINFFLALFLTGFPSVNPGSTLGFSTLASWTPQRWSAHTFWERFWPGIGAVLLVFSIGSVKFLQYPFTTSFAQFLGRISYSIYMVHGTLLHTVGVRMMPFFWKVFNQTAELGWGLTVGFTLFLGLLFWMADLVTRIVDERCVEFARWLSKICAAQSPERA